MKKSFIKSLARQSQGSLKEGGEAWTWNWTKYSRLKLNVVNFHDEKRLKKWDGSNLSVKYFKDINILKQGTRY